MIFYEGISEVVYKNPDICEGCLELLNGHVVELFGSIGSDDTRINLDLSKTIIEKVKFNFMPCYFCIDTTIVFPSLLFFVLLCKQKSDFTTVM